MIRVTGARVLRPDGSLRAGTVTLDGPVVAAVEDPPAGEPVPDLTVAPGLVDLQVNGLDDLDVWTSDPAALDRLGARLAAAGTTAWCPTLVSHPLGDYADWFAAHPHPAPGEVGVHLEGPFLSRPGAHRPELLGPPDLAWLAALPPRVRIVTLAPELPGAREAIATLAPGTVVSIGHSEATYDEAVLAAAAGARLVTHVFNAMPPFGHRRPGVVGAALTDERLTPAVIGDGVHVHPAALALVLRTGRAVLVSDSVAAGHLVVDGGAARLPDGTLAGSVVVLAEAVRVAAAATDLATALLAATAHPAGVLGLADRGRLSPGTRADVVAFDADLRVVQVWAGGEPQPRG